MAHAGGRPTDYTLELSDLMCERLSCGESMRSISRDDSMPALATIFRWLREKPEFKEQYAIAKEASADALADDMLDIADNEAGRQAKDEDGNAITIIDSASVAHARLRVDTRKWAASKLKPKKYGDKVSQELTGTDGAALFPSMIKVVYE